LVCREDTPSGAYRVRNFPDHSLVSQDKEEEEEDPRKVHGLQGTTAGITGEVAPR